MATPSPPPELTLLSGGREAARALVPLPGHRVSRSYAGPWAIVATHPVAVGVDLERVGELPDGFLTTIGTPTERAAFADADPVTLHALWSGKEALAKALGDAGRYAPDRLASPLGWTAAAAGRWHARRLDPELPDGFVGWVCWAD